MRLSPVAQCTDAAFGESPTAVPSQSISYCQSGPNCVLQPMHRLVSQNDRPDPERHERGQHHDGTEQNALRIIGKVVQIDLPVRRSKTSISSKTSINYCVIFRRLSTWSAVEADRSNWATFLEDFFQTPKSRCLNNRDGQECVKASSASFAKLIDAIMVTPMVAPDTIPARNNSIPLASENDVGDGTSGSSSQ
jgi:hypothetical protein